MFLRFAFVALAGLHAATALAQMYRWTDKDGRVHYTDTPPPAAAATNVEKKPGGGSVIETGQTPYATQQAAKNFPVTLYTASNCTDPCKDARALLTQRSIPFREVAVADEKSRAELKQVSGGDGVPVMTVGRQASKGFDSEAWHTALDAAGYPRSGAPLAQKPAAAPPATTSEAPKEPAEPPAPRLGRYAPLPPDSNASGSQPGPYAPR